MTPAILFVRKAKIAHDVLSYEHDPAAESYGREAVDLLQLEPATVFKTLVADAEGVGLVCAVVPVLMMLDLKALAEDCANDKVYEFMFVAPSIPVAGAVGAPVQPVAIK